MKDHGVLDLLIRPRITGRVALQRCHSANKKNQHRAFASFASKMLIFVRTNILIQFSFLPQMIELKSSSSVFIFIYHRLCAVRMHYGAERTLQTVGLIHVLQVSIVLFDSIFAWTESELASVSELRSASRVWNKFEHSVKEAPRRSCG